MSFTLDITYALTEKIGPQGGVAKDSLMALVGDFLDLHTQFETAKSSGLLPHMVSLKEKKGDIERFRSLLQSFDGAVVFVGDRGNLAALKCINSCIFNNFRF